MTHSDVPARDHRASSEHDTRGPGSDRNRDDLGRVFAYFDKPDDLSDADRDWVQTHGLGILHAEVLRLRAALARRAGSSL